MRIQPIGKGFKLTLFVYPNGWTASEIGEHVARTVIRLRRSLGSRLSDDELSRRRLIYQDASE